MEPAIKLGLGVTVEQYAVIGRVPVRGYTAKDPGEPGPVTVGADTHIGVGAVLYCGVTVGARCLIGDGASLYVGVRVGDRVRLGRYVTVNYDAVIGDDTVIHDGTHVTGGAHIGARCFIGPNVSMTNHKEPRHGYVAGEIQPPVIGDDVLIGGGAVLCPGVRIGDGATIGAGALVTRDVPAGATLLSAPGRLK